MKQITLIFFLVFSLVSFADEQGDTAVFEKNKLTVYDVFFGSEDAHQVCYPKDHRSYFFFIIGFAVIASIMGVSIVYIKNKNNKILKEKNNIIEQKNKDLVDSIVYAKRIQQTILPAQSAIRLLPVAPEILYKPKDIVSGDFYWFHVANDIMYMAVCDCTGHGVPGAMVSVVCSNALNKAVKEYNVTQTHLILDKTREQVIAAFGENEDNVNDGMDISLCAINLRTKKLQWSGANNPLWIIRNDKLTELKPDKQAIGKVENPVNFSFQEFDLLPGDIIYATTDGYADQFGGQNGKKFKYKPLKQKLLSISALSLAEQNKILNEIFEKWKGGLEQVDDVLIVGIKI